MIGHAGIFDLLAIDAIVLRLISWPKKKIDFKELKPHHRFLLSHYVVE
jgi:hypothetical protein